jgi:tetratricopeptide (TPR) repeat protein
MSFDIICSNCGAPSSPTTGICPFCKTIATNKEVKASPSLSKIKSLFNDGKIDDALILSQAAITQKPELEKNPDFVLLYVQVLLEVDSPSSKMRTLLANAMIENPDNSALAEYLEIVEARSQLKHGKNDAGEIALSNIIRRSPDNVQALFALGSHLFWVEQDMVNALKYLEKCVQLRPNFLKANACLAAIYKELKLKDQAVGLLNKCSSLTSDLNLKKHFEDVIKSL